MIKVGTGFEVLSTVPIDSRFQFQTLLEMKDVSESLLYDGILSYNAETDKYYTYSSDNISESLLGKWREFSGGSDIVYFNSQAEWEGARLAGQLEADKYYAYPPDKTMPNTGRTPATSIIYFSGKDAYELAKNSGQLDEGEYYSYIGGFAKGSTPIIEIDDELSDTSTNAIQSRVVNKAINNNSIKHFGSYEEWEAEKLAGNLDPNKYYSYPARSNTVLPVPTIELPETTLKVEYKDGSIKEYTIYCKEEV